VPVDRTTIFPASSAWVVSITMEASLKVRICRQARCRPPGEHEIQHDHLGVLLTGQTNRLLAVPQTVAWNSSRSR